MRKITGIGILLAFMLLSGCGNRAGFDGKLTEETTFAIEKAQQIVEMIEKPVMELSQQTTITKADYKGYLQRLEPALGDDNEDVLEEFFDEVELEQATIGDIAVKQDVFYPTIFHDSVSITDAKLIKTTEPDGEVEEKLIIREEYTGENKKLQGFSREYIYEVENGNFVFDDFEGKLHYTGATGAELKANMAVQA